jgi:hypothetical protein
VALRGRRAEFAALIRLSVADDSSPWELRDAADLLAVYGSDEDLRWLTERSRQAVLDAIPLLRTSHDLDRYESLSSSLRSPSALAAARERAREIIAVELDYLLHTGTDPEVMRVLAAEAAARAAWYGISSDIDITPLMDRAEDLEWEQAQGRDGEM